MIEKYTNRGWAIFPCVANEKRPATKDGFKSATNITEAAVDLFAKYPGSNMAIATGEVSNLFVLDIDKHGIDGTIALTELLVANGAFPETVVAQTPSGGFHYYFQHVPTARNRAGIRPGIDCRADGGYVVAPPSVCNGKHYTWAQGCSPDDVGVAQAPQWLVDLIIGENPVSTTVSDTPAIIPAGRRDATLASECGKLHAQGLNGAVLYQALSAINQARCEPPLPDADIRRIAESINKRPNIGKVTAYNPVHNDMWNAAYFHKQYGDNIRYCDALKGWYLWDGKRWICDDTMRVLAMAQMTVHEMAKSNDKQLRNHAARTGQESRIRSMINLCRAFNDINVNANAFDNKPNMINLSNGVYDLEHLQLIPHNREMLFTKMIPIAYDEKAQCPAWQKFLDDIFMHNADTIRFVQKAVGYSMSSDISEQCLFLLHGAGANGKTTFLETLKNIMGEYAMSALASAIMDKPAGGIPNDIARLRGARLVNITETDDGKKMSEALIKTLTGGDVIVARFLNREFFEFQATFKIFIATNHIPRIQGTDTGIWRRIKYIPFNRTFSKADRDTSIMKKLADEYQGILAWAIEGYKLWNNEGLGSCQEIDEATKGYQNESDIFADFIAERCVFGGDEMVRASDLYAAISEWYKRQGIYKISRTKVTEYLKRNHQCKISPATRGIYKGCHVWEGVSIKSNFEPDNVF